MIPVRRHTSSMLMQFILATLILITLSCKEKIKVAPVATPDYYPKYTLHLEDTIQTLDFENVGWFCVCAQWISTADYEKYVGTDKFTERCVFVEAADSTLNLPDTLGYSGDLIKFTGQFYKEKGYPAYYLKTEEKPDSARVFRYTKFAVVKSNYREFVSDSLKNK